MTVTDNYKDINRFAKEVFLLLGKLSFETSPDRIILLFMNTLNGLLKDANVNFEEGELYNNRNGIQITAGDRLFGNLYFDGRIENINAEMLDILNNAANILGLTLHRLEQESVLSDEKKIMGHLLNENSRSIHSKYKVFSAISEKSPDIILVFDLNLNCLYANRNLALLVKNLNVSSMGECVDDDLIMSFTQKEFKVDLDVVIQKKRIVTKLINSKKNKRVFEFRFIPEIDRSNNVTSVFAIGRDVTERNKIEQQLILAKERAEQSDKLKLAFLANISHEIRTPLNGIIGFARLLNHKTISQEKKGTYLKIIEASTENLLRTMTNILEISKVESGELSIVKENIELCSFMEDFYLEYQNNLKRRSDQEVEFLLEGIKDKCIDLYTDEYRLREIFMNLLDNAFKFTNSGYVKIKYQLIKEKVLFCIEDTGKGIKDENILLIFNRFFQEDFSERKEYGGLGLGLTLSKAMVEKLGGEINIESIYQKGTTIFITFPFNSISERLIGNTNSIENGFIKIEK